ncbi:uncharacterized protein LOC123293166 [Chrysoperla carnea]|uniref:uncharacterized protein LOC123293166 n=1 Tax=Chrysoperla carnea TaxID=189513 RepID=UPI001D07BA27|nr:uncharacterized protein LOC123293166 [Chrysoperla carnea]
MDMVFKIVLIFSVLYKNIPVTNSKQWGTNSTIEISIRDMKESLHLTQCDCGLPPIIRVSRGGGFSPRGNSIFNGGRRSSMRQKSDKASSAPPKETPGASGGGKGYGGGKDSDKDEGGFRKGSGTLRKTNKSITKEDTSEEDGERDEMHSVGRALDDVDDNILFSINQINLQTEDINNDNENNHGQ